MDYIRIEIAANEAGADVLSALLDDLGIRNIEVVSSFSDVQEALDDKTDYWDYADYEELAKYTDHPCVRAYIPAEESAQTTLSALQAQLESLRQRTEGFLGSLSLRVSHVQDEDWAENWKQYFTAFEVGRRLVVKPEWEQHDDPDKLVYTLDNSSIFGTGQHQTTRMCLELLERYVEDGDDVLDVGCGSGILSIVSLMLGAQHAVAVDIEEHVQRIAYHNARLNGIDERDFTVLKGDVLLNGDIQKRISATRYQIVVANIVADVIIALTPLVPRWLARGGVYIVSGIIGERQQEVERALHAHGFCVEHIAALDDWRALAAKRTGE
jgi:ribosomal protein L11 methyltransferase